MHLPLNSHSIFSLQFPPHFLSPLSHVTFALHLFRFLSEFSLSIFSISSLYFLFTFHSGSSLNLLANFLSSFLLHFTTVQFIPLLILLITPLSLFYFLTPLSYCASLHFLSSHSHTFLSLHFQYISSLYFLSFKCLPTSHSIFSSYFLSTFLLEFLTLLF